MKKDMQKLRGGEVIANAPARTLDADEMARALQQIPAAEREKLYYMIKGIQLMGEQPAHAGRAG